MLSFTLFALAGLGAIGLNQIGLVIIGLLGFIVAFGLAVFVHELGHFLAAKAFGVPVERFVIGFDKAAIDWMPRCIIEKQYGETTYGISLVPLGGYVKMKGIIHPEIEKYLEAQETKPTEPVVPASAERVDGPPRVAGTGAPTLPGQALEDMAALYRKPFWQKCIIYGAGVVMNMLLAMLIITTLYTRGFMESAPFENTVSWVKPGSTFAATGIAVGDRVTAVDGKPVANSDEMLTVLTPLLESKTGPWASTLTIERATGGSYTLPVELPIEGTAREDFLHTFIAMPAYIEGVVINGAADKAGLRSGDLVVAVDGAPITNWYQFRDLIRAAPGKSLAMEVQRGEERVSLAATPWESPEEKGVGQLGIMQGNVKRQLVKEPFPTALMNSPERTWRFTVRYAQNLRKLGGHLVGGEIGVVRREIGGPVGIAQVAYRQAQKGLNDWLNFLVVLNIALAVMNSLPLPVLDGGHICFALYEAIFRRPVPPRILVPILNGAFIFLMVFFVLVTFNDVLKIFL